MSFPHVSSVVVRRSHNPPPRAISTVRGLLNPRKADRDPPYENGLPQILRPLATWSCVADTGLPIGMQTGEA